MCRCGCGRCRSVSGLHRRVAAQPPLLCALCIAVTVIHAVMRAMSASCPAVGCCVGAVSLCMAARSIGNAIQIRTRSRCGACAVHAVGARERNGIVAAAYRSRAVASERGYNQALELALPLARALHVRCRYDVLRRTRDTDTQTTLNAVERRRNLKDAFALYENAALPSHVALLDDVFTTGTTLSECTKVLKRAGVTRVDVWALARAPMPGRG
jgi:ComF family protein